MLNDSTMMIAGLTGALLLIFGGEWLLRKAKQIHFYVWGYWTVRRMAKTITKIKEDCRKRGENEDADRLQEVEDTLDKIKQLIKEGK